MLNKRISHLVAWGFALLIGLGFCTSLFLMVNMQRILEKSKYIEATASEAAVEVRRLRADYLETGGAVSTALLDPAPKSRLQQLAALKQESQSGADEHLVSAYKLTRSKDLKRLLIQLQAYDSRIMDPSVLRVLKLANGDLSRARKYYTTQYLPIQTQIIRLSQAAVDLADQEEPYLRTILKESTAHAEFLGQVAILLLVVLGALGGLFLTRAVGRIYAELQLQKTILESQGEASMDGIVVVSSELKILSYNRHFVDMWDLSPEMLTTQSSEMLLKSVVEQVEESQELLNKIADLHQHPDEESHEEIGLVDGRILDQYSAPVRSADGANYGRVWFYRDITERHQAREAMQEARMAAEHANQAKSEFLSRMSHELRTPLNAILGFGQILEMGELNPRATEGVSHILKAGRHLLELINEALDIASIESGRLDLSLEPVAVASVVREVMDLVRPLANQRNIQLISELPDQDTLHILVDHQRFKQLLINLLSNAIKYNRQNGRVVVACAVVGTSDTPALRLCVSDTGFGLNEAEIGRLFTPFERLGAAKAGIDGTGIGLVLCKRLVEVMNGVIGVESKVGEGSTFWLEFPLMVSPETALIRDGIQHRAAFPLDVEPASRTLLYVEDNLSNLRVVEMLLDGLPEVRLLSAMQGNVGLDLAHQHLPNLIILDLHLPDMMGDEVLRRLRADSATSEIPVVMLSADATPGQIERLRLAGARDYLTKPLDVRQFLHILNETIFKNEVSIAGRQAANSALALDTMLSPGHNSLGTSLA